MIERFIGSHAFLWSYDSAPRPHPSPVSKLDRRHTGRLRKRDDLLTGEGRAWSRIIRPQESLVLYLSCRKLFMLVAPPAGSASRLPEPQDYTPANMFSHFYSKVSKYICSFFSFCRVADPGLVEFHPDLGFFLKDPFQVFSKKFPFDQMFFSPDFLSGLYENLIFFCLFSWDLDCGMESAAPNSFLILIDSTAFGIFIQKN